MTGENPYFHRGPIKDARYFYGRAKETALALQMVRYGQSVSVTGPRRIGKTSLLLHLADSTVQAEHSLTQEQSLFVYIDAQASGRLSRSDILRVMLQEPAVPTDLGTVDAPQVVDYRSFEQALHGLVKPGQQLAYLIDEFECLAKNQNLNADFFFS
jgi:AAA+ ATPase superfamily predicted ATPase